MWASIAKFICLLLDLCLETPAQTQQPPAQVQLGVRLWLCSGWGSGYRVQETIISMLVLAGSEEGLGEGAGGTEGVARHGSD